MANELMRVFNWDGAPLTVVTYDGRPAFLAAEISDRLGYTKSSQVQEKIRSHWAEEFEEGMDYVVLRGRVLKDFKALCVAIPSMGIAYTSQMMLLFESGVNVAALLPISVSGPERGNDVCQSVSGANQRGALATESQGGS